MAGCSRRRAIVVMTVSADTAARLALIRYFHRSATEQMSQPEPLSALGLLTLQDGIELFCLLAVEHIAAEISEKTQFLQYWDVLAKATPTPVDLGFRQAMRRLNRARVAFKHHGTMPSRMDLQEFIAMSTDFFRENAFKVFGVDFDNLTMVDLVRFDSVRSLLREGENALVEGDLQTALLRCSAGYSELRRTYRAGRWGRLESPLDLFKPSLMSSESSELADNLESFALEVETAFDQIDETLEALAIGVDVERLLNLRRAWPRVRRVGDVYVDNEAARSVRRPVPPQVVRESLDFVVECALLLQQRLVGPHPSYRR